MALANTWFDTTRKGAAVTVADDTSPGAAPTLVQSVAGTSTSGNSVSATLPSAPTAGNFLVAVVVEETIALQSDVSLPQPGWKKEFVVWGTYYVNQAIHSRTAKAGDSATVTFDVTGTSGNCVLMLFEFSGADLTIGGTYGGNGGQSGSTMVTAIRGNPNTYEVAIHAPRAGGPPYVSVTNGTLIFNPAAGSLQPAALNVTGNTGNVTTQWTKNPNGQYTTNAGFFVYNTSVRRQALATVLTAATTGSVPVQTPLSDKHYAEFVIGATLTGSARVGLSNSGFTTTGLLGVDANGIGYDAGGTVKLGNVTVATLTAFGIGDNIGMAVNRRLGLVWFRKNGGNWNNDVLANQDPENNIGGITLASISGNLYPAWGGSAVSTVDGRFKTAEWAYSAPTGYAQVNADPLAERKSTGRKYQAFAATGAWNGPRNRTPVLKDPVWPLYSLIAPLGPSVLITGVVQELGVPVADRQVFVFDRTSGALLGKAVSDAVGAFSIICRGRGKVMVVARGTTTYNAKIFDSVVPV
jgi:hypothetical protein